jgi:hypothetical protein
LRDLCPKEAVPMGRWQCTNPAEHAEFIAANCGLHCSLGDVEFTADGTCVNTTEGWREMRVGIFARSERGESVHPDQTIKTNRCQMASPKSRQHGHPLRRTLRKPMENVLDLREITRTMFYYTP